MRKKEGNKEKDILNAAIKVFAKYGYHQAKVAMVAEHAKVGTGSVYLYYENKQDILNRIFENLWDRMVTELDQVMKTEISSLQKAEKLIDILFDVFNKNSSLAKLYAKEHNYLIDSEKATFIDNYNKFFELIKELLEEGKNNGEFYSELNFEVIQYFLVGGLRSILFQNILNPKSFELETVKKVLKNFFKNGITGNN